IREVSEAQRKATDEAPSVEMQWPEPPGDWLEDARKRAEQFDRALQNARTTLASWIEPYLPSIKTGLQLLGEYAAVAAVMLPIWLAVVGVQKLFGGYVLAVANAITAAKIALAPVVLTLLPLFVNGLALLGGAAGTAQRAIGGIGGALAVGTWHAFTSAVRAAWQALLLLANPFQLAVATFQALKAVAMPVVGVLLDLWRAITLAAGVLVDFTLGLWKLGEVLYKVWSGAKQAVAAAAAVTSTVAAAGGAFQQLALPLQFVDDVGRVASAVRQLELPLKFVDGLKSAVATAKQLALPIQFVDDVGRVASTIRQLALPLQFVDDLGKAVAAAKQLALPIQFVDDVGRVASTVRQLALPLQFVDDLGKAVATAKQLVLPAQFVDDVAAVVSSAKQLALPVQFVDDLGKAVATAKQLALPLQVIQQLQLPLQFVDDLGRAVGVAKQLALPLQVIQQLQLPLQFTDDVARAAGSVSRFTQAMQALRDALAGVKGALLGAATTVRKALGALPVLASGAAEGVRTLWQSLRGVAGAALVLVRTDLAGPFQAFTRALAGAASAAQRTGQIFAIGVRGIVDILRYGRQAGVLVEAIGASFRALGLMVYYAWRALNPFGTVWSVLASGARLAVAAVAEFFVLLSTGVRWVWNAMGGLQGLIGALQRLWGAVLAAGSGIKTVLQAAFGGIAGAAHGVGSVLGSVWSAIQRGFTTVKNLVLGIPKAFEAVRNVVSGVLQPLLKFGGEVVRFFGKIWQVIGPSVQFFVSGFQKFVTLLTGVGALAGKVFGFFQAGAGAVTALAGALGPLVGFVTKLLNPTTALSAALVVLKGGFLGVKAPIVAVKALLTGMFGGFWGLINLAFLLYEAFKNNWFGIRDIVLP
ncbi:MAG: hypothetical protein NZ761_10750, partial [Dehalococcoidia bacterium]|nr:hypothetical protein [Dehalococcoidia bacterium]